MENCTILKCFLNISMIVLCVTTICGSENAAPINQNSPDYVQDIQNHKFNVDLISSTPRQTYNDIESFDLESNFGKSLKPLADTYKTEIKVIRKSRKAIIVSTIDGKLSCLHLPLQHDYSPEDLIQWQLDLGNGPLLSQSISELQLSESSGSPYRIVPSLDGSLYRLESSSLQSLSLNADLLLSSSFRISDDTFIVGSKEQIITGIEATSGDVLYQCGSTGCNTLSEIKSENDSGILLVRRLNNVVRAIDKTGKEEWNYKVGETELSYFSCKNSKGGSDGAFRQEAFKHCNHKEHSGSHEAKQPDYKYSDQRLRFDVPSGLIYATDDEDGIIWKYDLGVPITKAWEFDPQNNVLTPISVFDMRNSLASTPDARLKHTSQIYVGQYQEQIYIQAQSADLLVRSNSRLPESRKLPFLHAELLESKRIGSPEERAVALRDSFLSSVEVNRLTGFYLAEARLPQIASTDMAHSDDAETHRDKLDLDDLYNEGFINQVIYSYSGSVWHYWPQIILISILTSILLHLFLVKVVYVYRRPPNTALARVQSSDTNSSSTLQNIASLSDDDLKLSFTGSSFSAANFTSRYIDEFNHVRCLGKGGFGLVFEATHKIDDCSYAIKRVAVKNSDQARERILREVKALAKLDHSSIVRYYQAWFECPPAGWQEQRDQDLLRVDCSEDDFMSGSGTATKSVCSGLPTTNSLASKRRRRLFSDSVTSGPSRRRRRHTTNSSVSSFEHNPLRPFADLDVGMSELKFQEDESGSFSIRRSLQDINSSLKHTDSLDDLIVFADTENPDDDDAFIEEDSAVGFDCDVHSNNSSSHRHGKWLPVAAKENQLMPIKPKKSNKKRLKKAGSVELTDCHASKEMLNEKARELKTQKSLQPKLYLYIQMQLCQKQSLREWLRDPSSLRSRAHLVDIFLQITEAISFVHQCNMIHRDLKSSNIFFAMDGSVKIGDFGLATALIEDDGYTEDVQEIVLPGSSPPTWHTTQIGTRLYMSPEQSANLAYNEKVDIFSLGLIFFELFYVFTTEMERVTCMLKAKEQHFPEKFVREHPNEAAFAHKLLSRKPVERPSADAILSDALFTDAIQTTSSASTFGQRYRTFSRSAASRFEMR